MQHNARLGMTFYEKVEWVASIGIEWKRVVQRMTKNDSEWPNDNEWYNQWQLVTTSGTMSGK